MEIWKKKDAVNRARSEVEEIFSERDNLLQEIWDITRSTKITPTKLKRNKTKQEQQSSEIGVALSDLAAKYYAKDELDMSIAHEENVISDHDYSCGGSDHGSPKVDNQKENIKNLNKIDEFETTKTDVCNDGNDICRYTELNSLSGSSVIEEAVSHDILLIDQSNKSLDGSFQLSSNIGILNNEYFQYNGIDLNIQDNSFSDVLFSPVELPSNISDICIELNIDKQDLDRRLIDENNDANKDISFIPKENSTIATKHKPASTLEENITNENIRAVLQDQTNSQQGIPAVFNEKLNVLSVSNEQVLDMDKQISKKRKRNENEWKKNIHETRKHIHSNFYNLKNWELQTMYIQSAVKVCAVGRKRTEKEII
ncbi:unnamed protein product [Diabrotica balteata]|uniref:Uncharacterized protein n=1 Tax=Diabrotica balteata TaxID=107213 RepID=A0A9N9T840_DIABA|nr:unnamed protein product [Diabrotica balteata]